VRHWMHASSAPPLHHPIYGRLVMRERAR